MSTLVFCPMCSKEYNADVYIEKDSFETENFAEFYCQHR